MPNGKVHSFSTIVLAAAFAPTEPIMALGAAAGILVGPDLDVDNGNISVYYLRKVSPVLAWAWRLWWWPYAKLMPHRGALSHAPVISTLIRLVCVLWPFWLIWGVFWPPFYFVLGLMYADLLHWLADKVL